AGESNVSSHIIKSLRENAIVNSELGMYWKELTQRSYWWYQAPIETQSLMIEVFSEVAKDAAAVSEMKTWLLKNKQTNSWGTTKATAEAVYALLLQGDSWLTVDKQVQISLGNQIFDNKNEKQEEGTGYFKRMIDGVRVKPEMGNIKVTVTEEGKKSGTVNPSWGAVYWQYFEDLDKITFSETNLKLSKKLFLQKNSDRGPVLIPINEGDKIAVGDKITVRIELRADRDMEYVHMKDMRASCMEPIDVLSGYRWQGGLGYYQSTKDVSTNFFFSYLPKGTYVFEYSMFVTHEGDFSNGITSIQSMYAPEFTAHSEGVRVSVGDK
ncbi:MAG TPA: alpha-2-macroglobulin, partial [Ginsengibacter sp.]|nr:alpha-2-macroglobulin [Ginsengibacter sp.]